jgi:hypothetical protein
MTGGLSLTDHLAESPRHSSFYLSCGEEGATPIIFVHGWPELSISPGADNFPSSPDLAFARSRPTCAATAARASRRDGRTTRSN